MNATRAPSTGAVTAVLVDDHRVVREGTRLMLEGAGVTVLGEATTLADALQMARALLPAVMMVDVQLERESGIEVVRAVTGEGLPVRCLVFSAFDDYVFVTEALAAGASGYLLKTASATELVAGVRAVAAGAIVLDSGLAPSVVSRLRPETRERPTLTPRELDVVQLMARGRSNKEIAAELDLGLRTVESHVSNVLTKLDVRSRTEAVLHAIRNHLVAGPYAGAGFGRP